MRVSLIGNCVFCNKTWRVKVDRADLEKYMQGALVQDAFSHLPATDRECIISGMCPTCQDKIFG